MTPDKQANLARLSMKLACWTRVVVVVVVVVAVVVVVVVVVALGRLAKREPNEN